MIIEFRVQNYRSFRSEQTLSFVASNYDKSLPENVITPDLTSVPELRLVKAIALYGPNAGGKTNVLLALKFLRWLAVESFSGQKPDATLPVEPFALDKESLGQRTKLQLTFAVQNMRYELAVAVTKERVVQERLVVYPSSRAQIWYDRVWNVETKSYDWSADESADFERDPGIVEKTRPNALFLSTAAQWNNTHVAPIYEWFSEKLSIRRLGSQELMQDEHNFTASILSYSSDERKLLENLLRSADFGLTNVAVRQELPDGASAAQILLGRDWRVTFQHQGKNGDYFPIDWKNKLNKYRT